MRLPCTQDELDAAMRMIDLPNPPTTTELRIAAEVSGLGNKSCGPLTDLQYRATAEPVDYRFVLGPPVP